MQGFTTKRLKVRNWTDDLSDPARRRWVEQALTGILTKPVLSHLPEPLALTGDEDAIATWVTERAGESDVFLIAERSGDTLIGLLLLAPGETGPNGHDRHLGYLLKESAWGQGYATELVEGLIEALQPFGPYRLMGGVGTENRASAHVLEKTGFRKSDALSTADTDIYVRQLN